MPPTDDRPAPSHRRLRRFADDLAAAGSSEMASIVRRVSAEVTAEQGGPTERTSRAAAALAACGATSAAAAAWKTIGLG